MTHRGHGGSRNKWDDPNDVLKGDDDIWYRTNSHGNARYDNEECHFSNLIVPRHMEELKAGLLRQVERWKLDSGVQALLTQCSVETAQIFRDSFAPAPQTDSRGWNAKDVSSGAMIGMTELCGLKVTRHQRKG